MFSLFTLVVSPPVYQYQSPYKGFNSQEVNTQDVGIRLNPPIRDSIGVEGVVC